MAKLRTTKLSFDGIERGELEFSIDVYVNTDGEFTTTLPKEIAEQFEEAGLNLIKNRSRNKGFFSASTYDDLISQVKDTAKEYMSRELISEKIVIRYVIQTTCTYCLDPNGHVVPNGSFEWTQTDNYLWKEGTLTQNASSPRPFGFQVYCKPYTRRDYKYRSGKKRTEYDLWVPFGSSQAEKGQYYLHWLESIASMEEPEGGVKEIEYTENIARFFVEMVKSICALNEKIKDFLEPDSIKMIAETGRKLIG